MSQITKRNKERHSHDVPQCKNCKAFMKKEEGHNTAICPNCGVPNTYWVDV